MKFYIYLGDLKIKLFLRNNLLSDTTVSMD